MLDEVLPENLYAGVRKSKQTGMKTYFYTDDKGNELIVASYMMKTNFMKVKKESRIKNSNYTPVEMGEGQHAIILTRYNPNSTIVKKQFTSTYGDPLNVYRLSALINLHVNKRFRELNLASFICLPFQIRGKDEFVFMKKLPGASLEELSREDQIISVTKYQVMLLLDAIKKLADEEDLRIVHTDIHAGNIVMTDDGTLVLIDFDECISTLAKRVPQMVDNDEYIENPTEDDYLNGYTDDIPQKIPKILSCEEEDFYQSEGSYDYLKNKSIEDFKNLFLYGQGTLFNDEIFQQTPDFDNKTEFEVRIRPRNLNYDPEQY